MRYFIATRADGLPKPEAPTQRLNLDEIKELLERDHNLANADRVSRQNKTTTKLPRFKMPEVQP